MPQMPPGYLPPGFFPAGYFGAITGSGSGTALTLSVPVPYTPDAGAAVRIVQSGVTYPVDGTAYPAVPQLQGDGSYNLTLNVTIAAGGLAAGPAEIEAGDYAGGVFSPQIGTDGNPVIIPGYLHRPEITLPGSPLTRTYFGGQSLLLYQGETQYYLKLPVSDDLGILVTSATAVIASAWSGLPAPLSANTADNGLITTNVAIGGGLGYLALALPAGWDDTVLPAGDWLVNALLVLTDSDEAYLDTPISLVVQTL